MSSVLDRGSPLNRRAGTRLTSRLQRLPTRARPHQWGDPLLVGGAALAVYALHGYDGGLDRDLGVFAYGGIHVAHGTPPYVGIFNSVGPLADAVPGLAIWLGHLVGADPILSARLFFTLLSALCCSLLCVLARDSLGSRAAGFIAPTVFLTFADFLRLASDGPREKTTMVVFLLGCLILLGRRRWALAGACAALATLTWQPVFAVTVAALAVAALLDEPGTRRRALLGFTVGGLVPSLAAVAYFLGAGSLTRAIQGFILINVEYVRQPSVLSLRRGFWTMEWAAWHWTLPLVICGLMLLPVLGARALPQVRSPAITTRARRLVVCASGGVVATAWTVLVVNGGPDLFVLLPFAALGLAGTAVLLLRRVPGRWAVAAAVAVVSLGVMAAGLESVTTRSDRLLLERADVNAVLGTQPGDAGIVSLSAPQVLALAGRDSPVPYQIMTHSQMRYLEATYPGGLPGFLRTLVDLRPTFVVVGKSFTGTWPDTWLGSDFWRVGGGSGWTWYLNRSAGPEALRRARMVHDEVLARFGT